MNELSNEDNAGAELLHTPLVAASGEGEMDEDDDIRWLDTEDDFADAGSSTVTTRNRELAAKNSVGELPVDDGDGEVDLLLLRLVRLLVLPPPPLPEDSPTRVTWNRLREGLGTGDAMGDGIGLGNGERKRPPGFLLGSSRWCWCFSPTVVPGDERIEVQVSEIFLGFRCVARTRLIDVLIGSDGSGGFLFRSH